MTAQDLKNAILQLAMQGKLVPQDPNDEPAAELLKRIKAEKEWLIKEGKIKKDKPLTPISADETPFDIPESWEWVRLSDISSISSGGTPSRANSTYWNGDIPWVKIGDISSKHVTRTEEMITEAGLNSSSAKVFPKGTLLYTIFATIGTVGILDIDAATNQAVAGITFYGEYNLDYLYYILFGLKDLLVAKGKGMAQMNINQTILKNTPIPVPPLAEQQRIVAKIEELMPLVEEYGKAEERLTALNAEFPDKLRKSILQQAIQGKLTERDPADEPASELLKRIRTEKEKLIKEGKIKKEKPLPLIEEEELPFDLPDEWQWVRLGEIILGTADGPHYSPQYYESGIPFISTRNIASGKLDFSSAKYISYELHRKLCQRCKPRKGDVLYSKGGTTGIAAVNDSDIEFNVWVHVAVLSMGSYVNPYYLALALNSPHCYELSQKYTHGTSNRDLGLTRMVKITLPLPSLAEQQRIVDRVNELLAVCDELKL